MRRVIIESPYAGKTQREVEINLRYLRLCMHDALLKGEAPYASHGLYTQPGVLDDRDPDERKLGIDAGFAWRSVAGATVVYVDLGITEGMRYGIADAKKAGRPVEYRRLFASIGDVDAPIETRVSLQKPSRMMNLHALSTQRWGEVDGAPLLWDRSHMAKSKKCKFGKVKRGRRKGQCLKSKRRRRK